MALTVHTFGANAAPSFRVGDWIVRKGQYQPDVGSYNLNIMYILRG